MPMFRAMMGFRLDVVMFFFVDVASWKIPNS